MVVVFFFIFKVFISRPVKHRDLKPENIFVRANGYPVLTDFGFSKFIVGPTFTFCGTADYLAPEVDPCSCSVNILQLFWREAGRDAVDG